MVDSQNIPRHVAIIMDGNGRWAKQKGFPRTYGHKVGTENVRKIVKYCSKRGIEYLTVYAFSTENFKRPADEVGALMKLLVEYFNKETQELKENGVRLNVIGDISTFSPVVQEAIQNGIEKTKDCTKLIFTIALAYGARAELVRAFKNMIADSVQDITEEIVSKYLYTFDLPDPDLIIRTSGEERLSNFLLYQAAYSEFYFTNVHWPDFDENEFEKALEEFARRIRRFGGV
ncbi:MAG: isoprenyl transferase [Clostridia bacterium]|nr:isoprenyl transferase [Clostridia bacterium]